jgi:hypothetical protein
MRSSVLILLLPPETPTGTPPTILYVTPNPAANYFDFTVEVGWTRVLIYIDNSVGSEVLKFDSDVDIYALTSGGDLVGRISTDADSLPFRKGRAYVIRPKEDGSGPAGPDTNVRFQSGGGMLGGGALVGFGGL